MGKKKSRNCIYCGRFKGRFFHSCPQKKRALKRPDRFDGSSVFEEKYNTSALIGDTKYNDTYESYRKKVAAGEGGLISYRVYDENDKPIGWYKNEYEAQIAATGVGGWVREFSGARESIKDQNIVGRIFAPKRDFRATDGNDWEVPQKVGFEQPSVEYKVYDRGGQWVGTYKEEYEARSKAEETGGVFETYGLKHAYRFENPREHMSFFERLRDSGTAYKRVSPKHTKLAKRRRR